MIQGRPIMEDDLHAFVDRILDPARQADVQAYLDAHADVAARIAGYIRQREALRTALAPVAQEPIPPGLTLRRLVESRRASWSVPWRSARGRISLYWWPAGCNTTWPGRAADV